MGARRVRRFVHVGLLLLLLPLPALAQPEALAPCPAGNLLASKGPWAWQDVRGQIVRVTDGEIAPEGAIWDAPIAVILDSPAATLTWDLGAVLRLQAAWIQADANDYYSVWGSTDGRSFRDLGRIDPVEGHGLRGRKLALGGMPVRYLRFGEGQGDGRYSVSEVSVFCAVPLPFPPAMRIGQAQPAAVERTISSYWNDTSSARWQLVLALLGLALLGWDRLLDRTGSPGVHRRLRNFLLGTLGVLAAFSYVNFGFFHFNRFLHEHEWTHYYLGAKYSTEVSYDRLYHCLSTADAEDGLRRRVELRKITNLRTNVLESTDTVLAHPELCKSHFSEARWRSFKGDVAFFRGRQGPKGWDDVQVDHGFNGTPVWTVAGKLLSNLSPANPTQIWVLAMLDPLYLVGTVGVVAWAFGWRVLCVALLVFATNFPSRFYWTGGAFLRWDWLFYTVAAICCLKKERPWLAGAALGYATLLRVFPIFLFLGPALALGWRYHAERRIDRQIARFFAGAALAGALLLPASLAISGGVPGYQAFVRNTLKHQDTPLTNNMGLRTVVAWRPKEVGRLLYDQRAVDPWGRWKAARLEAFRQARPLYLVVALGFLGLLAVASRRAEPWVAAALSVTFCAVGVELLSYYFAFVIGVVLLCAKREEVGPGMLVLTAVTQFLAWAPVPGMSTWLDERYTGMSAATLVVFAAILWRFRTPSSAASAGGSERRR